LPRIDIMPNPEADKPGRAPGMFFAHVVFGVALGKSFRSAD
jgi:hypothetical protein